MTTPADNTPFAIIYDAYGPQGAGLLQEGQSPNPEQLVQGMRTLTEMINLWQTQGLKLWLNEDIPVPLTAGRNLYPLKPSGSVDMVKPLRVISGYYQDESRIAATAIASGTTYIITSLGNTNFTLYGAVENTVGVTFTATATGTGTGTVSATNTKRPLTAMARDDYVRLSQTVTTGAVNSYFVDKQQLSLRVFLWLTPDSTAATGTVHLVMQTQVVNPINLVETMNFPTEWRIALKWGLADELAGGQPQSIMDRCATKALMYKKMLEDWDIEDVSVRFTPDSRSQYYSGKFR